jgi:hypothetical protein
VSTRHSTAFDRDSEEERGVCRAGDRLANRLLVTLGGVSLVVAIGAA